VQITIPAEGKFPTEYPFEVSCGSESFLLSAPDSKTRYDSSLDHSRSHLIVFCGLRRQWIRIIKAKTGNSHSRTVSIAPALLDMLDMLESNRRRTIAVYQSKVVNLPPPSAAAAAAAAAPSE
jgi:hypothetical protein